MGSLITCSFPCEYVVRFYSQLKCTLRHPRTQRRTWSERKYRRYLNTSQWNTIFGYIMEWGREAIFQTHLRNGVPFGNVRVCDREVFWLATEIAGLLLVTNCDWKEYQNTRPKTTSQNSVQMKTELERYMGFEQYRFQRRSIHKFGIDKAVYLASTKLVYIFPIRLWAVEPL